MSSLKNTPPADLIDSSLPSKEVVETVRGVLQNIEEQISQTRERLGEILDRNIFNAEMAELQVQILGVRDKIFHVIHQYQDRNRAFGEAEAAIQEWALSDPDAKEGLDEFMQISQQEREKENKDMADLAALAIELQQKLEKAFVSTTSQNKKALEKHHEVSVNALVGLFTKLGGTTTEEELKEYIFSPDESKLEEILLSLPHEDTKRRARVLLSSYKAKLVSRDPKIADLRSATIGSRMMKAVTATDAGLQKTRWLDSITDKEKNVAYRQSTVNVYTDTGSHFYFYVDKDGEVEVTFAKFPGQQNSDGPLNKERALAMLQAEQNPDDKSVPTSSVIYGHRYEENEIQDSLKEMVSGGNVVLDCEILVDPKPVRVFLKKNAAGAFEYVAPTENHPNLPAAELVAANPAKYLRPTSLRFLMNGMATKVLTQAEPPEDSVAPPPTHTDSHVGTNGVAHTDHSAHVPAHAE